MLLTQFQEQIPLVLADLELSGEEARDAKKIYQTYAKNAVEERARRLKDGEKDWDKIKFSAYKIKKHEEKLWD